MDDECITVIYSPQIVGTMMIMVIAYSMMRLSVWLRENIFAKMHAERGSQTLTSRMFAEWITTEYGMNI